MKNKLKISTVLALVLTIGFFAGANKVFASSPDVTCNSATVYGNVVTNGTTVTAWFEWGTSLATVQNGGGTRIGTRQISYNTQISTTITGLNENTTYYYRVAVQDSYGSYVPATTESFTTTSCTPTPQPPTVSISANPPSVSYNGFSSITWSSDGNVSYCTASGGSNGWAGQKAASGSFNTGNLTNTTTYSINCTGPGGTSPTQSTIVTVNSEPNPIVNISADDLDVQYNGSTIIHWNSQYASKCSSSGGANNWTASSRPLSGMFNTGNLTSTAIYNISCQNSSGKSASNSITVNVKAKPAVATGTLTLSPTSCIIQAGAGICRINVNWTTNNASSVTLEDGKTGNLLSTKPSGYLSNVWVSYPSTTFYLKNSGTVLDSKVATSSCAYGSSWNGTICQTSVPDKPTAKIYASPSYVQYGNSSSISWSSTGASYCTLSGIGAPSGKQLTSGSFSTGALYQSSTYSVTCRNFSGAYASDSTIVNVGTQPIITGTLTLSPTSCTIAQGASTCTVSASWQTQNANSVTLEDGNTGNVLSTTKQGYSKSVWVAYPSTIFYLKNSGTVLDSKVATSSCAYGSSWNGTICQTNVPNNPTVTLSANPTNVDYGNSSTLTWNSQNATSCTSSGGNWSGSQSLSGSASTGALYQTTTFTISCGVATDSVTIYVNQQNNPVSVNIYADNTNLSYNSSTTVRWNSQNATSCSASGGTGGWSGTRSTSGSFYTGTLYGTTTYSITCQNSSGQQASSSVTIYTNNNNNITPTVSTQSASGIGYNNATLNGYVTSNGGSNTMAWFQWGTNSNYYNQTNQNNYNSTSGTSYSYHLSGLTPNTTYYFRAVAQNSNGQVIYGNQMTFTTNDSYNNCNYYNNYNCNNNDQIYVSTYSPTGISSNSATLNGYVSYGGYTSYSYVSRWFEWGPNGYLNNRTNETSQYSGYGNFNQTIYNLSPNTIYRYRAAARKSNGSVVYGNTYSFTTTGSYIQPQDCSITGTCTPTAITLPASNIAQSSATLNGTAIKGDNVNVNTTGYFEYGTTQSLGQTTKIQTMGNVASVPFFQNVTGLSSNTTYYFRAVVTNQYGTSRGDIYSLHTGSVIVYTPTSGPNVIYRNTTVVSNGSTATGTAKPSMVFLSISNAGQTIYKGDTISYVINYKNVSTENLNNVLLRVALPKELEWRSTSLGTYSAQNNMVIANIGNLAPQQEGSIQVSILVSDNATAGKNVVVTADLAYTVVKSGDQEEVFAYSENLVGERGASLGAAAFFGTGFLPGTLLGWMLLILLIMLLVAAVRWLYERSAYGSAAISNTSPADSGGH